MMTEEHADNQINCDGIADSRDDIHAEIGVVSIADTQVNHERTTAVCTCENCLPENGERRALQLSGQRAEYGCVKRSRKEVP